MAASVALAACGEDDTDAARSGGATEVEETTSTIEAMDENAEMEGDMASTESGAATLRADLTSLLQEHVYLAGIAIETALDNGGDMQSPAVQAAVETLDANTVALADAVGSVSTPEDREAFLGLWREHIGYFVDYTLGKATGDQAAVETALTELDGYQQAAGDFFERITGGELPSDALVESLDEHVATLTAAIDAVVAGDASAFMELREAGQHMPMAALALSSAIVAATS